MTISPLPIGIIVLVAAMMSSAHAQTGKDLFVACTSKNPVEQMSCTLYISGFVHGLQAAEDLSGKICVPKSLTGNEASIIFTETLADIKTAAAPGRGLGPEANPFFTSPQNAALAATLGMKFRCPQKGDAK
jgi:hypothetical protein